MPNTNWTLSPHRERPILLPGLNRLALYCDFETDVNALAMVFGTLNKSQEASKGFRDFRPELSCEASESEADGS